MGFLEMKYVSIEINILKRCFRERKWYFAGNFKEFWLDKWYKATVYFLFIGRHVFLFMVNVEFQLTKESFYRAKNGIRVKVEEEQSMR